MNKTKILGTLFSIIFITSLLGGLSGKMIKSNLLEKYEEKPPIISNTGSSEKEGIKKEYENKYTLINGLPLGNSDNNKNMLISLINESIGTINIFPYNYYTGINGKERLSSLSNKEVKDFFIKRGIVINKQINIDQEDIFKIYIKELENMGEDELPYISIKGKNNETTKIKIGSKENFYEIIKSNSLKEKNIEQIYFYIINKLGESNNDIKKIIKENTSFYNTIYKLPLSEKQLFLETLIAKKGYKIKVDKNFHYLNALIDGKFKEIKLEKLTTEEKNKIKGIKKKLTLKEKLKIAKQKRLKKKK